MAQELTEATGPGFFKLNRAVSLTQLDPSPPPLPPSPPLPLYTSEVAHFKFAPA